MFTGIIETLGTVTNVVKELDNVHLTIKSSITNEMHVYRNTIDNNTSFLVGHPLASNLLITSSLLTSKNTA